MKLVKEDLWLPATVWYEISINLPQEVRIEKQKTQYDLSLTIEKKKIISNFYDEVWQSKGYKPIILNNVENIVLG